MRRRLVANTNVNGGTFKFIKDWVVNVGVW